MIVVCSDRKSQQSANSHITVNKFWLEDFIETQEMPNPELYGFSLEDKTFYLFDTDNKVEDDRTELSDWASLLAEKIKQNSGQVETLF